MDEVSSSISLSSPGSSTVSFSYLSMALFYPEDDYDNKERLIGDVMGR